MSLIMELLVSSGLPTSCKIELGGERKSEKETIQVSHAHAHNHILNSVCCLCSLNMLLLPFL